MGHGPRFRNTGKGSFFGDFIFDMAVPQDHFLRALKMLFDWQELGERLIRLHRGRGRMAAPPMIRFCSSRCSFSLTFMIYRSVIQSVL